MKIYIKNSCSISPQQSFSQEFPWKSIINYNQYMTCVEPNYKDHFPPLKLRRMSRMVKMGITAAKVCLTNNSGTIQPDAIITSTGWGCLDETIQFLDDITSENKIPSPATFINSTHNTPGGQIALTFGCKNYNNVISNGKTSFENALLDAWLHICEGSKNILIGGMDEISEKDYLLKKEGGVYNTDTYLPGEGVSFFLLSDKGNKNECFIPGFGILNSDDNTDSLSAVLQEFLQSNGTSLDNMDLILASSSNIDIFNQKLIIPFKKYCGEYDTSTSFALWLSNQMLINQNLPDKTKLNTPIQNILIYNTINKNTHAVTLVSKADL